MSDYDSSLPVRTENAGDVIAKIADATIPAQQLKVNADGSIDVNTLTGSTVLVSNFPTVVDTDYGVVGANTIRTASQIGNATGAADFNAGATGAQTLRVTANQGTPGTAATGWFVRPTDGTNSQLYTAAGEATVAITTSLPAGTNSIGTVVVSNFPTTVDTNYGVVGNNTIRTASQIGNATGQADFNFGVVGAQTLRTAAEVGNATGAADFNFGTVGAQTLRVASQIGNATGAADFNAGATTAQTLRVVSNTVDATGTAFSLTNPLPVVLTDATPGTSVNDYNTVAVAAGASSTHTYTVPGGETFYFNQIEASASGKMKIEVQVNGVTKWVQFNSTAETNMTIHIDNPITVAAAGTVTVIRTNRDNQSQDVYSTISGYLLP